MAETMGRRPLPGDGQPSGAAADVVTGRLADWTLAHGTSFVGGGNWPIRLDDPEALWFVARGSVDVFVAREQDGDGALVEFKHLLHATPGRLLFHAADGPNVLVAKGLPDSELRRVPRDTLLTADEDGALVDQVDLWVADISAAVAVDVTHRPPIDCFLAAGATADLNPDEVVSTKAGVLWMSSRDVGLAFLGTEEPDRTGPGFVPVAPGSWVSVSGPDPPAGRLIAGAASRGTSVGGAGRVPSLGAGRRRPQPPPVAGRRRQPARRANTISPGKRRYSAPKTLRRNRPPAAPGQNRATAPCSRQRWLWSGATRASGSGRRPPPRRAGRRSPRPVNLWIAF